MSVSAINQLNSGSLPASIAGGVPALPPKVEQDPRVQQAQAQAAKADAEQEDIAKRKAAEMAPLNADIAQKNQDLSAMAAKGPDQVPLPENNAKHIDPKQLSDSFSAFMTLGALAGLLSKTPMTAALNNMTAAINGVQAGDQAQYDKNYKEFQVNYQKAVDTNKAKVEEYNRIFANSKMSLDEKIRESSLVAAKYGDELVRSEARMNNYKGVQDAINASVKSQEEAQKHKDLMDHQHAEMQQQQQFHRDQMVMEAARLKEEQYRDSIKATKSAGLTPSQRFQEEQKIETRVTKEIAPIIEQKNVVAQLRQTLATDNPAAEVEAKQLFARLAGKARDTNIAIKLGSNYGDLVDRIGGHMSQFFTGTRTQDQRQEMLKELDDLEKYVHEPALQREEKLYNQEVSEYGLTERPIISQYLPQEDAPASGAPAAQKTKQIDGITYRQRPDGQWEHD